MSELGGGEILAREGQVCVGCPQERDLGMLAAGGVCRGCIPVSVNGKDGNVCGRGDEAKSLREISSSSPSTIEGIMRRL